MKASPHNIHWKNARNWKWGLYVCREDPRVIVPKKPRWAGRTLNFAHRQAYGVLFVTLLAIVVPFLLILRYGTPASWVLFFATLAGIVAFYYCFELPVKTDNMQDKR
jgi:hypothetical protein